MLSGIVDEFAVWDTALDADTITSIYNSGEPNDLTLAASYTEGSGVDKTGDLQGYWRMKAGTGTVLEELTGNVLDASSAVTDATLVSGTGWSADTPTNTHEPNVLLGEYV